jgi:plastocyanin
MKFFPLFIPFLLVSFGQTSSIAKSVRKVSVGTLHGQLRYSPEVFGVKPGSKISLTLKNSDEMIHNLVLVRGNGEEADRLAESRTEAWGEGDGDGIYSA